MKAPITSRQWEQLSAYLDKKLSPKDQNAIEAQLASNPELKKALNEIKQIKGILRSVPAKRIHRNFTLSTAQVKPARRLVLVPVFRYASLAASLALVALLAVEFLPGLLNLSAFAPKAAQAPMMMAASAEQQPTETPPLIIWNGYAPGPSGGAEGKGGGGNAYGIGGGAASNVFLTPTPEPSPTSESETVAAPQILEVQPPVSATPAPTSAPERQALQPTQPPSAQDQMQKSSEGPFLGIQPTEMQGMIATAPAAAPAPLRQAPSGFHFSLLNYVEVGLAVLAVGFIVTALFLRKRT